MKKDTKASTFRLNPELQTSLEVISAHFGMTKNKIVNQAVAEFLEKRATVLRDDLDSTLQKLRVYGQKDSRVDAAIERFVVAEAAQADGDAHEGRSEKASEGSLSQEIEELIHA